MSTRKNEASWIESRQRWQINVSDDGQRRTFVCSTPGRKGKIACERKADSWLEEHLIGENTRVEKLLDDYAEKIKKTTSTSHYRQYNMYIRLYAEPVIGSKRISKLSKADLQSVIDTAYSKAGLAKKTLENIRGFLMSWLKYCRDVKATTMYIDTLTIPKSAKRSKKEILLPDELGILFTSDLTTFRSTVRCDFLINAYRFAVATGMRPGELVGLHNEDIKGNKVTIVRSINDDNEVTQGKNENAQRTIVLGEVAMQILADQKAMLKRERKISQYVFPYRDMDFIKQQTLRKSWQRYCAANGIEHAQTPYELRHTFVSINDEMPEGLKKKVVGHSQSMDTEGTYGHEKQGDMEKAAEYVDGAIKQYIS